MLCANSQTLAVARRYQPRSELMIDGGLVNLPEGQATHSSTHPVVLWVGKMEARKDPLAALDVAAALRTRLPNARVVMIGDGWLFERVREELRRRQLEDFVV